MEKIQIFIDGKLLGVINKQQLIINNKFIPKQINNKPTF